MSALPWHLSSDAQLVRRFRRGDEAAFAALHDRYAATVRSYAAYMLRGTPHDADDAAQDVFLRAYEALRRDERRVELRPWLFRVAHNRCLDLLRRPRPLSAFDGELHAPEHAEPGRALERREALRELLRDIGALPERQRSALLLRELGGLSHDAVADALGISVSASKMLVVRARLALTEAAGARGAACAEVRERLAQAADAGARPRRADRLHVRGCPACAACERARARLERELALLPAGGGGLLALLRLAGGGGAGAGAGGGVAAAGSGGAATGAKLAAGLCCAALGLGGGVAGVRALDHAATPGPRARAERHVTPAPALERPRPVVVAAPATAVVRAPAPHEAPRPAPRPAPAAPASRPVPAPTRPAAQETIDAGSLDGTAPEQPPAPRRDAPPGQETVDLGQFDETP